MTSSSKNTVVIYLYKIVCLLTGLVYIGQTVQPEQRWYEHKKQSRQYIDRAIKEHGAHNFVFEIIAACKGSHNGCTLESALIAQYDSFHNGYNKTLGGSHISRHSAETKRKISASLTGKKQSDETKAKLSRLWKGKPWSENRRKIPTKGRKLNQTIANQIRLESAEGVSAKTLAHKNGVNVDQIYKVLQNKAWKI